MNDHAQPEAPPAGESSTDEEADFDAFFRSGEEGTYRGGPGDSVAPVYADLYEDPDFDEPDEAFYERAALRDERRDRYRGYVSRFVGVLAIGVLVLVAVRVREGSPREESRFAAAPVTSAIPAGVVAPAPPEPAVAQPTPEPAADGVEVIALDIAAGEDDEPEPAPSATPPPPVAPAAVPPRAPSPAAAPLAAVKPRPRSAAPVAPQTFPQRPAVLPASGL